MLNVLHYQVMRKRSGLRGRPVLQKLWDVTDVREDSREGREGVPKGPRIALPCFNGNTVPHVSSVK